MVGWSAAAARSVAACAPATASMGAGVLLPSIGGGSAAAIKTDGGGRRHGHAFKAGLDRRLARGS